MRITDLKSWLYAVLLGVPDTGSLIEGFKIHSAVAWRLCMHVQLISFAIKSEDNIQMFVCCELYRTIGVDNPPASHQSAEAYVYCQSNSPFSCGSANRLPLTGTLHTR